MDGDGCELEEMGFIRAGFKGRGANWAVAQGPPQKQ